MLAVGVLADENFLVTIGWFQTGFEGSDNFQIVDEQLPTHIGIDILSRIP